MSNGLETTTPPFMVGPTKFGSVGQVYVGMYVGRRMALTLIDPENFEQILVASVNMVNNPLPDRRHIWLKGWSENEGVPQALVDAGVVELVGQVVSAGYAFAEQAKLTDRFVAALPPNVQNWINQGSAS